jgi:hypothetical protein
MTHFEDYRWEDRVPRKGDWQFSLVAGALAFGLLATALPEPQDGGWAVASDSSQSAFGATLAAFDAPPRDVTAPLSGIMDQPISCLEGARSMLAGS